MRASRIAVVWRGDEAAERQGLASNERLRPIVAALDERGALVEPIVYRDEIAAAVESRLAACDGVLAWVDPIGGGEDRARFDALLRQLAASGVFVSAHPDVIALIGTKEILFTTRDLGWGGDVHRYDTSDALRRELPGRLAAGPRVLKQRRGNGGIGVWKIDRVDDDLVSVHHAHERDLEVEQLTFAAFVDRCATYFDHGGCVIDQRFQPRVAEGMIRVYLVGNEVVGFARQSAASLLSRPGDAARVMGLPSPKTMLPPDDAPLHHLRQQLERDWLPAMLRVVGLTPAQLPLLWDADFLLGPADADGADTYVLCEINASCITPFPSHAVPKLADAAIGRVAVATRTRFARP